MSASLSNASEATPAADQAHLWVTTLEDVQRFDPSVLSTEEAGRYRNRPEAALGRIWLRHVLSAYAPLPGQSKTDKQVASDGSILPASWRFETLEHGKPLLVDTVLHFNISHSGEWLALVISSEAEVGVDIQCHESHRDIARLAKRYFSELENQRLAELDGADARAYFYHLWALKEAWAKARGAALPTALNSAAFSVGASRDSSIGPCIDCELDEAAAEGFWLYAHQCASLAVCVRRSAVTLMPRSVPRGEAAERSPVSASLPLVARSQAAGPGDWG